MAGQMGVRFLGRIPIDPQVVEACDSGKPFVRHYNQNRTAKAFKKVSDAILQLDNNTKRLAKRQSLQKGDKKMRIAIPVFEGKLSQHFGHCDAFAIVDTDDDASQIVKREDLIPPPHEPGVLPSWLHGEGVNVIIAGGMGQRAQQLFARNDIKVVIGATTGSPEELVSAYLGGTLETGDNICDH